MFFEKKWEKFFGKKLVFKTKDHCLSSTSSQIVTYYLKINKILELRASNLWKFLENSVKVRCFKP